MIRNFFYRLFGELARRANNGELFNKRTSSDSKDILTSYFWKIAIKCKGEIQR